MHDPRGLPADSHVHSEWSWDTSQTSMLKACERAVGIGLPAVAFTEHVDFTAWGPDDPGDGTGDGTPVADRPFVMPLDVEGYLASVDRCRHRFPGLRVLTGIEAGEPHWFAGGVGRLLARAPFERVLGSLHTVVEGGRMVRADRLYATRSAPDAVRTYLGAVLDLVARSDVFEVLAHVDFAVRSWPHGRRYDDGAFEAEYRAVFAALAASDRVLEINTRSPLVTERRLRWWREEGGRAVSFGSDAHQVWRVGARFPEAVDVAAAAGFRPGRDPVDFWRR